MGSQFAIKLNPQNEILIMWHMVRKTPPSASAAAWIIAIINVSLYGCEGKITSNSNDLRLANCEGFQLASCEAIKLEKWDSFSFVFLPWNSIRNCANNNGSVLSHNKCVTSLWRNRNETLPYNWIGKIENLWLREVSEENGVGNELDMFRLFWIVMERLGMRMTQFGSQR